MLSERHIDMLAPSILQELTQHVLNKVLKKNLQAPFVLDTL